MQPLLNACCRFCSLTTMLTHHHFHSPPFSHSSLTPTPLQLLSTNVWLLLPPLHLQQAMNGPIPPHCQAHLLPCCQRLPVQGLRLAVLALVIEAIGQVVHEADGVRVLLPKYLLLWMGSSSVTACHRWDPHALDLAHLQLATIMPLICFLDPTLTVAISLLLIFLWDVAPSLSPLASN